MMNKHEYYDKVSVAAAEIRDAIEQNFSIEAIEALIQRYRKVIKEGEKMAFETTLENFIPEYQKCHDCGCMEGEMHEPGCDMERCPFCGGQLISCGCCYEKLGLVDKEKYPETDGLSPEVYDGGLLPDQEEQWDKLLKEKGTIPYIIMPNICGRCGLLWPDLFNAEDWEIVIPKNIQKEILCYKCYEKIKGWMTNK